MENFRKPEIQTFQHYGHDSSDEEKIVGNEKKRKPALYIPCSDEFFGTSLPILNDLEKLKRMKPNEAQHSGMERRYETDSFFSDSTASLILNHPGVTYWDRQYKDIVVLPSLTLNTEELKKIEAITHYEERQLFNLILLRHHDTRIIYITSQPIDCSIVEYYWKLLPGRIPFCHIRHRLLLISAYDASPKPLSLKVLERPRLIQRIRSAIRDPQTACLTCFNSSLYESTLASLLGIHFLGAKTSELWWGTKAGSRQVFQESGVPHPVGSYVSIKDIESLAHHIAALVSKNRHVSKYMVKLNDGFSGEGNAILDLKSILGKEFKDEQDLVLAIKDKLSQIKFCSKSETWESFSKKIEKIGCIVEFFIDNCSSSPSFQACIDTSGEVIILSTHEQILGGEDKQTYQGCSFPALDSYRQRVQEYGKMIGYTLAKKGVIDHFAVDFVIRPKGSGNLVDKMDFDIYAIEINLRQGGTTHPLMTLKLLTGGQFEPSTGMFRSKTGSHKFYVASDNVKDPSFQGLLPHDIMEHFFSGNLHFCHQRETGVVFHLLGALSQFGKIGVTAVGNSVEEANQFYEKTIEEMKNLALDACSRKESILSNVIFPQIEPPTN